MSKFRDKRKKRILRHRRVRSKVFGTSKRPRLSVFRSSKNMFLQLIDDTAQRTLVSASTKEIGAKVSKTDAARGAGKLLAEKAQKAGIKEVVFDRGGLDYHGRVKAVAEEVRKGGIKV